MDNKEIDLNIVINDDKDFQDVIIKRNKKI